MDATETHDRIRAAVIDLREDFTRLSLDIHAHPETAFEERHASQVLRQWLAGRGFSVEAPIAGLDTAFRAVRGSGLPVVTFLAEYDALPGLGHACGHNLIGAGAATAAAALAGCLPGDAAQVQVIGTPGEEGGGGKVVELEAGVFDGVDAALMFHPADRTLPWRHALSSAHLRVSFHGRAAHAAKNPEEGRNALAAMILFFNAVDALRQHIGEKARIHGVIRHGGAAPNVVPEFTEAEFLVRDMTRELALALVQRVTACAEGAAAAAGVRSEVENSAPLYAERKNNRCMAARCAQHLRALGVEVEEPSLSNPAGSSDVGNVSLAVPTIHPYLQIADRGVSNHTAAFRDAAASPRAHDASLKMIAALAQTAADLILDPLTLRDARREFETHGADPT